MQCEHLNFSVSQSKVSPVLSKSLFLCPHPQLMALSFTCHWGKNSNYLHIILLISNQPLKCHLFSLVLELCSQYFSLSHITSFPSIPPNCSKKHFHRTASRSFYYSWKALQWFPSAYEIKSKCLIVTFKTFQFLP